MFQERIFSKDDLTRFRSNSGFYGAFAIVSAMIALKNWLNSEQFRIYLCWFFVEDPNIPLNDCEKTANTVYESLKRICKEGNWTHVRVAFILYIPRKKRVWHPLSVTTFSMLITNATKAPMTVACRLFTGTRVHEWQCTNVSFWEQT